MKKIYKIMPFALAAILVGCNKYLDREPLSDITPQQYFNTEGELGDYVITRYDFPSHLDWNAGTFILDNDTDNQATADANGRWHKDQWKVPEKNNKISDETNSDYAFGKIRDINYFLQQVEPKYAERKIAGNETNIKHYIGEAYFLRAYQYFNKLKAFGDYPILKEVLPDDKDKLIEAAKRRPQNEVAHFILEDLDKAISMLKSSPVEGKNRISKEVAQLFRSRVALYEGTWLKYHKGTARVPGGPGWPGAKMDYLSGFTINIDSEIDYFLTEAMASAKEVAEKFSLTDNNHNVDWTNTNIFDNPYFKMFGDVNMTGYSEILLWRQYNSQFIGHHTMGYLTQGANSGYTKGFVDTFLMKSGLPYYAAGTDYKGDVLIKNVRENRDERLQLFMRAPGDYIVTKNPNKIAPDPGLLEIKENRSVTGYDVVKGVYNDIAASSAEILSTSGCIIFRATEAYLNYIEASYEKEGALNGTALNYWGQLRTRAGLPADPNVTIAATDLDKENDWAVYSAGAKVDPTLYNIRRERRCELIAEGMRWADLRRWCALDQVKNYQIEGVNLWAELYKSTRYKDKKTGKDLLVTLPNANPTVSAKSVSTYLRPYQIVQANNLYYNGYTWTPAHYLSPIPYDNFWLASHTNSADNSVIYQNPGWPIAPNRGAL
ncbi:RagB/SusD family nutrient uptake outer membrane protein [Capnocytophaga haemolytica]